MWNLQASQSFDLGTYICKRNRPIKCILFTDLVYYVFPDSCILIAKVLMTLSLNVRGV